jgi:predicted RNase H-like nuclease
MNGCRPLQHRKDTVRLRRALLKRAGVPSFSPKTWRDDLGTTVGLDDIIDAPAMLWAAWRVGQGRTIRLPDVPVRPDDRGLDMAIWV